MVVFLECSNKFGERESAREREREREIMMSSLNACFHLQLLWSRHFSASPRQSLPIISFLSDTDRKI